MTQQATLVFGESWAYLPTAIMLGTLLLGAFKGAVLLALLRQALGGVPPASLAAGLALLLSVVAMAPLTERQQRALASLPAEAAPPARIEAVCRPLRDFLTRATPPAAQARVAARLQAASPTIRTQAEPSLPQVLLAFVIHEFRVAFVMGVVLLLPFFLLDLLCAFLLAGLHLPGLAVRTVSLPFKLLLFVACDGWSVLCQGLLTGYSVAAQAGILP